VWLIGIVVGSLMLSFLWFLERTKDLNFITWITQILPVLVVGNLFYWYGFRSAPDFLTARYVMSAMTHTLGWLVALFILKEGVTPINLVGIGFIMLGILVLLVSKGG